jgi:hypothetical protein
VGLARRDKESVTCGDGSNGAGMIETRGSGGDDIEFVLFVRGLVIGAARREDFERHGAMAHGVDEGFAFGPIDRGGARQSGQKRGERGYHGRSHDGLR